MSPRRNHSITDELVKALQNDKVRAILGGIFDERLKSLAETVDFLLKENDRKTVEIKSLTEELAYSRTELAAAKQEINSLETYNRRDNLIICGLPLANAAEAASAQTEDRGEHMAVTEKSVLALCNTTLQVPITAADISIAHRLGKNPKARGPPSVIVRFATRKAREAVYAARFKLKHSNPPMFINEDLTKVTASLFNQARKLVSEKKIYKTWTNHGDVYIKETDNPNCKPVLVRSPNEFP